MIQSGTTAVPATHRPALVVSVPFNSAYQQNVSSATLGIIVIAAMPQPAQAAYRLTASTVATLHAFSAS